MRQGNDFKTLILNEQENLTGAQILLLIELKSNSDLQQKQNLKNYIDGFYRWI